MADPYSDPRGSIWRRWDPHLHAPGTALNDQFSGSDKFENYLDALEAATPALEALGVTDYLGTQCYADVVAAKAAGRLSSIELIFPNIELRLSIGTTHGKGINFHLLVSPDDPKHITEIDRFLAGLTFQYQNEKYHASEVDLCSLGRAYNPKLIDDRTAYMEGVNQFKVDFNQLRSEIEASDWIRRNVITAVAVGSNDGTSGLQDDTSTFAAQRQDIEAFANVILSGSESQVGFWLGEGKLSAAQIADIYGGLKPCIHGSDAHTLARVGSPDQDRRTWIKGDPVFESLRQACFEPKARVFIGPLVPELQSPEQSVKRVATPGATWFLEEGLDVNPGLVAIIGARGSGKTALADLLAHGAGSALPIDSGDSFLRRASKFLTAASVRVEWSSGDHATTSLTDRPTDPFPEVHYLSQQFVERLCSSESANDELLEEIHKVVFASHEPETRLGSTTFDELVEVRSGDTRQRRQYLRDRLDLIADDVQSERTKKLALPTKRRALAALRASIKENRAARDKIVSPGSSERAGYYVRLRSEVQRRQQAVQQMERTFQADGHLESEAARFTSRVFPDILNDLQQNNKEARLTDEEWRAFAPRFAGNPAVVVGLRKIQVRQTIDNLKLGGGALPAISLTEDELTRCPLVALKGALGDVAKEIGIDKRNEQRLVALNQQLAAQDLEQQKMSEQINAGEGSDERLAKLFGDRATCYKQFFELVVDEERILSELYSPLETKLSSAGDSIGRLRLKVVRRVDLDSWAVRGEELIDLRKAGKFKGRGSLASFAKQNLVPAWEAGTAEEVGEAMAAFRTEYDGAIQAQSGVEREAPGYQQWVLDVGRWLYSTDHIRVGYSFEYDGIPLSQLSPGTRGIVLLLLYLALDLEDHRPLIIDQPEENLDPKSVFRELVDLFRIARSRRQVIIVTHNANLVVNTDVDQVIVASCSRTADGAPPTFTYRAGGLENAAIRSEVCEILEGGEAAFRQRAKRLRVEGYWR